MLHRIISGGKFRLTLESLQETGVSLIHAVDAADMNASPVDIVMTLESLRAGFGTWLSRKHKVILSRVRRLQELKQENRNVFDRLLTVVQNDLRFSSSDRATFEFMWQTLPGDVQEVVGGLFLDLYDTLLGEGDFRVWRYGEYGKCGKSEVVGFFREEQPHMVNLCPACDGFNTPYILDVPRGHDDLDHYLPKGKYPLLAVSPDNIVPVCLPCNSCFKVGRDPIEGLAKGALEYVYTPYARAAVDEVSLEFELRVNDPYPYLSQLVSISSDTRAVERTRRLNSTLELDKRWRQQLAELDKQLVKLVLRWADDLSPEGGWTIGYLVARLEKYLQKDVVPDIGKSPLQFVNACFIRWAIKEYAPVLVRRINDRWSA